MKLHYIGLGAVMALITAPSFANIASSEYVQQVANTKQDTLPMGETGQILTKTDDGVEWIDAPEVPKYATGTTETAGLTKLYSTTGQNTGGAMTQKATSDALSAITTALDGALVNTSTAAEIPGMGKLDWAYGNDIPSAVLSMIPDAADLGITAAGLTTDATGNLSFALGNGAQATSQGSLAIGELVKAQEQLATAIGLLNTASGERSSAFGYGNTASGAQGSAFGLLNTVSEKHTSAFGLRNEASRPGGSAFGQSNKASGGISSAFGYGNTASGSYSSAFGHENTASGMDSSAFGYKGVTGANATLSTQIGPGTVNTPNTFSVGVGDGLMVNSGGGTSGTAIAYPLMVSGGLIPAGRLTGQTNGVDNNGVSGQVLMSDGDGTMSWTTIVMPTLASLVPTRPEGCIGQKCALVYDDTGTSPTGFMWEIVVPDSSGSEPQEE